MSSSAGRHPAVILATLLLAAASAPGGLRAAGQQPVQVDVPAQCVKGRPDVAPRPADGFVVAWSAESRDDGFFAPRVYTRLFGPDGRPAGPRLPVTDQPAGRQLDPAVATDAAGNFVVVWWEPDSGMVRGQRFTADGQRQSPPLLIAQGPFESAEDGLDVGAAADGSFVVAFSAGGGLAYRRYDAAGQQRGEQVVLESLGGVLGFDPHLVAPSVAVFDADRFAIAWTTENRGVVPSSQVELRSIAYAPNGAPSIFPAELDLDTSFFSQQPAVAFEPSGDIVLAWLKLQPDHAPDGILAQRFHPGGSARGEAFHVESGSWLLLDSPSVAVDPAGTLVFIFAGAPATGAGTVPQTSLYARAFAPDGEPRGPASPFRVVSELARTALTIDGRAIAAVWVERGQSGGILEPPDVCWPGGLFATRLAVECIGFPERLCLADDRFAVEVAWTDPYNDRSGAGQPVPLTSDTGAFWFFDEDNVELVVKVLDGHAVNERFWVFYGALSTVGYTITVTDTQTGAEKTYTNPPFKLASHADTDAFPATAPDGLTGTSIAAPAPSHAPDDGNPVGPCNTLPITITQRPGLCLAEDFEVEVVWHDPFNGTQGVGTGVALSNESGYFWFFGDTNVELVVKLLDGRGINGRFWFFYGALTNVEYTIRVRHAPTGRERTYDNPPFELLSRADTDAFALP